MLRLTISAIRRTLRGPLRAGFLCDFLQSQSRLFSGWEPSFFMMPEPLPTNSRSDRLWLAMLCMAAFAVRLVAAFLVENAAKAKNSLCLFDDTRIYWKLAGAIRAGGPYAIPQFGIPHFALRTPGYPLFLATCQTIFGADNTLAPRVVQAVLGAICVILVYSLTRRVWPTTRGRTAAWFAAGFAAFEPYWAGTSALLLSEAVFVPLMLLMLWGLAVVWPSCCRADPCFPIPAEHWPSTTNGTRAWAVLAGLSAGAAILVKPSWALAPPLFLLFWVIATRSLRTTTIFVLALLVVMAPWWIRNAQVFGRFVPTALWAGASLYDGIRPDADGSSDMKFIGDPRFVRLNEVEQDRALRVAASTYARANSGRVAVLAVIKAGRFWSLWPNAKEFRATVTNLASAVITLPIFALLLLGLYDNRRDVHAWIFLAGPLAYFFALHLIFVSSIRYRIPAMVPAFGLVGAGFERVVRRTSVGS